MHKRDLPGRVRMRRVREEEPPPADEGRALVQGHCPCYGKEMSKVTSKLQVTVPKVLADKVGIRPGDEIDWLEENGSLRVVPRIKKRRRLTIEEKLAMFDASDERQRQRDAADPWVGERPADRGWTREELYEDRGRSR